MKSICTAAFLVLAAAACTKSEPVNTTSTTSAEALPSANTNGITPPPAVPELGKDATGQKRATSSAHPTPTSSPNTDGMTTTASIPATDDTEIAPAPAEPTVAAPVPIQTTTTTTTVTTTKKKAPVEKPSNGYGTGAARGNGINSTGPVGQGGGGVR